MQCAAHGPLQAIDTHTQRHTGRNLKLQANFNVHLTNMQHPAYSALLSCTKPQRDTLQRDALRTLAMPYCSVMLP